MSVCLAAIIDLSESARQKMRYFSIGSVIAGIAFVVGPFLGGKLADPSLSPLFNPAFPLQVGGYLAIINFFVILFLFHETLHEKAHAPFDFLAGVHNVKQALKTPTIKNLYIAYLLYFFGWNMIFQFVPALLVDVFKSSFSIIGNVSSVMGLVWIVGTVIISTLMHYKVCPKWTLYLSLIGFAIVAPFTGFQTTMLSLLIVVGVAVLFAGGMWPIFASSISGVAEKHMQGKIMGLSQSMQSLAMVIAPLLGGVFIRVHPGIPFILSAVASILSLLVILPIKLKFEHK
jgi:MFS transporter, DHA1 family, tetracycline resistance protein